MAIYIQFNEIRNPAGRVAEPTAIRINELDNIYMSSRPSTQPAFIFLDKRMGWNSNIQADITQSAHQAFASITRLEAPPEVMERGFIVLPWMTQEVAEVVIAPSEQFAIIMPHLNPAKNPGCTIVRGLDFMAANDGKLCYGINTNQPSSKVIQAMEAKGHRFIDLSAKP